MTANATATGAQADPKAPAGTETATAKPAAGAAAETPKGGAAAKSDATPGETGKTVVEGAQGTPAGTETGGKADQAIPESKAPEKYELKVPDAGKAYVDDADLKYLEDVARESGWSNEDAQAALEEHVATVKVQADRWAAETRADKEYGGDKLTETQRLTKLAIDRLRPAGHARRESFLRFMGRGGAGNHIEVVAFLADLGRMMGEDSPTHARSAGADSTKDVAQQLYDHPTSKALDEKRGA
jgi:hypothetical protein